MAAWKPGTRHFERDQIPKTPNTAQSNAEQLEAGIAVKKSQVMSLCAFLWRTNMDHKKEMDMEYILDLVMDYGITSFYTLHLNQN